MHLHSFQRVFAFLCAVALWARVELAVAAPPAKAPPRDFAGARVGQTRMDNGLKTPLVWIPPGDFTMGSPNDEKGRQHNENQVRVTLTKGFWLGQHVVTQAEWQRVMQTTPWSGKDHVKEGADYPATWVTWFAAIKFCEKLTETERNAGRLPSDWQYTLPTEAQWEYACRAGTKSRYSFGDEESDLANYAWFGKSISDSGENCAQQVGRKRPNPWGLFDMHGNVWEWCLDVYAEKVPGGVDPEVSAGGLYQVSRGGCWDTLADFCRAACRLWDAGITCWASGWPPFPARLPSFDPVRLPPGRSPRRFCATSRGRKPAKRGRTTASAQRWSGFRRAISQWGAPKGKRTVATLKTRSR
jgi:sulfatase modifying factor 1